MVNKKSKLNKSGMSEFSKAYTARALKSVIIHNIKTKAATSELEEKSEKLPTVIPSQVDSLTERLERIKGLLNECYGCQFEEVYAYEVNGALCFVEYPEDMIEQFEMPEEILADLKDMGDEYTSEDLTVRRLGLDEIEQALEEELMSQKQLIKAMSRELRGTELKELYAYKVNDVLCLDENLEAMANQLGIPQQMRAGLKDVGYLCNGTTPTGEEITVGRIGLEEAIGELAEQIFPSLWSSIKELENELSGISFQSEEVYAYQVNDVLHIVESPEAVAQNLDLPEAEQAALKGADDEYHGRDIKGKDVTVKRVGLYDAVEQLAEQILSRRQLIKEMAMELHGTELKEVYPYQINGELLLAESPEAMANRLGLPEEELAEMRVGDKGKYDGEAVEGGQIEIERISLNKAVEELQAKLYATSHFL